MKTTRCFIFTLLIFVMFVFAPKSFAQHISTEYIVRIIYLLPNDRKPQSDIDEKLEALIKETQQLLADEMERHGYSSKSFRFEADENGKAIVHHITSYHDDKYFQEWTGATEAIRDYFADSFDFEKYKYLVALDVSKERLGFIQVCGIGSGGMAWIPASGTCFNAITTAHELGHTFGLTHNFNNDAYIMSYGEYANQLSDCAAEWLDVHPFFNPDKVLTPNQNTSINLLSSTFDETPPYALHLRFEIDDPDGLQQAQHHIIGEGFARWVNCKSLSGTRDIVEFVTTEDLNVATIYVIDKNGNYMSQGFKIDDIAIPTSEAVSIPDANLARAIRKTLNYAPEKQIKLFDMSRLRELNANQHGIKDLTGLQHAMGLRSLELNDNQIEDITLLTMLTSLQELSISNNKISKIPSFAGVPQLTSLDMGYNSIRDLTPLANMIQLRILILNNNPIQDITPLTTLTQLHTLFLDEVGINDLTPLTTLTQLRSLLLRDNGIRDITPLAKMPQLTSIYLDNNQIQDITPIAKITQLEQLYLAKNQIQDISPLAMLTSLSKLYLDDNEITDITPLAKLTKLETLYLPNNQISDVHPLAELGNLQYVVIHGNQIKNRQPLLNLLRKNPDVKIYLKRERGPLPVSLSSFRAEHTNAGVVLKWITESEVDNAGFYIYRSQTKDGEFKVVNPKLIQGAGTTGERHTYTWIDTTAKPNVVYYYRIEDVSHAGARKQLATVRLRGFVSATGKLTTSWADLKTSR